MTTGRELYEESVRGRPRTPGYVIRAWFSLPLAEREAWDERAEHHDALRARFVVKLRDQAEVCQVAADMVEWGRVAEAAKLLGDQAPDRLWRECPMCGAAAQEPCGRLDVQVILADEDYRELNYPGYARVSPSRHSSMGTPGQLAVAFPACTEGSIVATYFGLVCAGWGVLWHDLKPPIRLGTGVGPILTFEASKLPPMIVPHVERVSIESGYRGQVTMAPLVVALHTDDEGPVTR